MIYSNRMKCILISVFVVVIVTTACGFNFSLPLTRINTGPTQTVEIQVPLPEDPAAGVELNLEFLAGKMRLSPGATEYLASGTASYNAALFEPVVENGELSSTLRQGEKETRSLPDYDDNVINEWDLEIADRPLNLNINAGAYEGNFELGGLSLEKLAISEGGSDLTGTFSEPNHVEMSSFTFNTGGSSVELTGLANANFKEMIFTSGAGDYTLSFDGDLQRDTSVRIESGVSTVNIIIPEGVNATLTFDGGLTGIENDGTWEQNGNSYTHPGSGPILTITVKMGVGSLNLKSQ